MQVVILAVSAAVLLAVVGLTAVQLRGRRGRWPLVVLAAIFYLLAGNVISRGLTGIVYPANPSATGLDGSALELLRLAHSTLSLATASVATIIVVAGLRRALPRADVPRG